MDRTTDTLLDPALRAARTFNTASDTYDAEPLQFWSRCGRRTVAGLKLARGARVLDVPCGTGATAIPAAHAVGPGGHVLACDVAERMLARARDKAERQGLHHVEFRLADMRAPGVPASSFDAVICQFGLFFVPDMAAQVRTLWSLVKPGGQLAITTWGPRLFSPAVERLEAAIAAERPDLAVADHPWERVTTPEALSLLLREAGIAERELLPIELELESQPLHAPEDWWIIARGGGMRWTLEQLGEEAAARVRDDNIAFLRAHHVTALRTDALYAVARKLS
jgi:ubiquinone/menaquinone biosynthesis C-methylase UbiE